MPSSYPSPIMSRASTSALDHQWDPYEILNVQRDNRCVGWAHSKDRKCYRIVNRRDMDTFYGLLTGLSSRPLHTAGLQPDLRRLVSFGLCKQDHRGAQNNSMVDGWIRKIEDATRRTEPQRQTRRSRSTTASLAHVETPRRPSTRTSRSTTSTMSAGSTSIEAEIESTLRCLEANREQERILMLRLADLRAPAAPRLDAVRPVTRVSTTSVSSLHLSNTSGTASSPTLRDTTSTPPSRTSSDGVSTTSNSPSSARLTPSSSSSPSTSSPPQAHRRQPHAAVPLPPATPSTVSQRSAAPSRPPTSARPSTTQVALNTPPTTPQHQRPAATLPQTVSPLTPPSSSSRSALSSCGSTHARRLPVADNCPICYEAMQEDTPLEWCRGGCGQSVHGECMSVWREQCVADGRRVGCTMCRTPWRECGC